MPSWSPLPSSRRGLLVAGLAIVGAAGLREAAGARRVPRLPGTHRLRQTSRSLLHDWRPDGPPRRTVLLYPSLARTAADFDALTAALLAAHHRVLAVDPLVVDAVAPSGFGLDDLVADAVALLDAAGARVVDAIGHAFGSRVVRLLAQRHPARVGSTVCLACGGRIARSPEATAALLGSFDLTLPDAERLRHVAAGFFAPGNDATPWLAGWLPRVGMTEAATTIVTPESEYFLGGPQPMLILQGAQDVIAPPANADVLLAERRARGDRTSLRLLDPAGHALLPEQPVAIASAVRRFLRS